MTMHFFRISFVGPAFSIRPLVGALLLALPAGLVTGAEVSTEPATSELAPPPLTSVGRGSLRAIVQAAQDIRLSARAAGVIQRYEAEEGQLLRKDAPILVLDDNQEKAELAQAEAVVRASQAELAHAEGEFERAKPLSEERIFSDKQFAEAKYALEVARSRLAQAEAAERLARVRLADRTIVTPFDGIFLKKSKGIGEAIERFEPVARIVDLSFLEIVVYCDASLFGLFSRGAPVSVQVAKSEETPAAVVQGTVSYVDPIIDPASGTFRVRVRLPASTNTAPGYIAVLLPPPPTTTVPAK